LRNKDENTNRDDVTATIEPGVGGLGREVTLEQLPLLILPTILVVSVAIDNIPKASEPTLPLLDLDTKGNCFWRCIALTAERAGERMDTMGDVP